MNKQEIPIPEGYDVLSSEFHASWNYGTNKEEHVVITRLEKKQKKDFSFYVDQYLYENGSTNDQIVNWLSEDIISIAKHRLKTSQFSLVPWEIKMGLFKFICEDNGLDKDDIIMLVTVWNTKGRLYAQSCDYIGTKVTRICSHLMSDIFNTMA